MPCNKKGNTLATILKITQIIAIVWALLVAVIYLSLLTNVLYSLPYAIREVCVYIIYLGIWGGPVLSVISCIELLILKFTKKHFDNVNKKLTIAAVVVPWFLIIIIMLYELNVGEVLS